MTAPNELPIPPDARSAEQAMEVLRAWVINESLHVSVLPAIWSEGPETWGVLLADVARQIAAALAEAEGLEAGEALRQIVGGFRDEIGE